MVFLSDQSADGDVRTPARHPSGHTTGPGLSAGVVSRRLSNTPGVPHREAAQPDYRRDLPVDRELDRSDQPVLYLRRRCRLRPVLPEVLLLLPLQRQAVSTATSGPSGKPPKPASASKHWTTGSPPVRTRPGCRRSATGCRRPRSTRCCASGWPGCRTRSLAPTGPLATATTSPCCRSSSASPRCSTGRSRDECCSKR